VTCLRCLTKLVFSASLQDFCPTMADCARQF